MTIAFVYIIEYIKKYMFMYTKNESYTFFVNYFKYFRIEIIM